jgi:hypothetical protein
MTDQRRWPRCCPGHKSIPSRSMASGVVRTLQPSDIDKGIDLAEALRLDPALASSADVKALQGKLGKK